MADADGPSTSSSSSSSTSPPPTTGNRTEYLVKWRDRSYKHCAWVDERLLMAFDDAHAVKGAITRFCKKNPLSSASPTPAVAENEDGSLVQLEDGQYFNPDYLQVDRIISRQREEYYVKWKGLGYDECTWEEGADIANDAEIARYFQYSRPPLDENGQPLRPLTGKEAHVRKSVIGIRKQVEELKFKGGRQLREYQIEGVAWMAYNFLHSQPSLLADEMVHTHTHSHTHRSLLLPH